MAVIVERDERLRGSGTPLAAWALLAGGVTWFVGGGLHPKEDPPGVSLKEHLHVMYLNDSWYPSHALLLLGIALIAAALVSLSRAGTRNRRVQRATAFAAGAAAAATVAAFLHLVMAVEADRIAAHQATPVTDLQVVLEAVTAPVLGLAIATLAVLRASSSSLADRAAAVLGVVGGGAYGLAGGTFWFTDSLNALFPLAGCIGVWAVVTAVSVLRDRAPRAHTAPLVAH